jgi:hypothetical protein
MRQREEFSSYQAAVSRCDELEAAGEQHYCILTNTPRPGRWTVSYGESKSDMLTLAGLSRAMDERQARLDEEREATLRGIGRQHAAHLAAREAGLSLRDAEVFVAGFCGTSAKVINPRGEDRESIFRDGRKAYADPHWQQAARAAAAAARKDVPREFAAPIRMGGLIANGECD